MLGVQILGCLKDIRVWLYLVEGCITGNRAGRCVFVANDGIFQDRDFVGWQSVFCVFFVPTLCTLLCWSQYSVHKSSRLFCTTQK